MNVTRGHGFYSESFNWCRRLCSDCVECFSNFSHEVHMKITIVTYTRSCV